MMNDLRRQLYLLDFTLSSLFRRKGKNLALLAVFAAIVFMLASALLYSHALRREAAILLKDAPELVIQKMVGGRHDLLPQANLAKLSEVRGITGVHGRLWGYLFDPIAAANYTVMVPQADPPEPGMAVIGEGISGVRGAEPGDQLSFKTHDGGLLTFRVSQVIAYESALATSDLFLVNEVDYRRLYGIAPGLFTDAVAKVRNPREVGKAAEKIAELLPDSRIVLRDEILRTYESVFDWREGLLLVLLTGAVLAFAIFAWEKASGLSAEERREIGILKAVGWETGDILLMKMWEGGVVSLSAFLIGYLLAYLHVFHLGAPLFETVLKGWATMYPAFKPTPFIDGFQVATLLILTVLPYLAATVVPIWRAAIIDPDQVMR
jgi:ABC-type lipoprotein release transport system permease subunit